MNQNEKQTEDAMIYAMNHEEERLRNLHLPKPKRGDNSKLKGPNGIDIGIDIRSKGRTIEVKGSRDKNKMIPDAHGNEFHEDNGKYTLVADYLYLVRFEDGEIVGFYPLSREEVGNEHTPIKQVRFASSLQTALKNGKFPSRLNKES